MAETVSYNVVVKPGVDNEPDGRSGRKRKVSEMTDVHVSKAKRPRTAGSVGEHQFNDNMEWNDNQMCKDSKRNAGNEAGSELIDINSKVNSQRKTGPVTEDLTIESFASSLKRKRGGIISENFEYKRRDLKVHKLADDCNHGDSLKTDPIFQYKVANDEKTNKTENVDLGSLCTETDRRVVQEHRGVDNIGENMDQSFRAAAEFHDGTKEVKKTEQDRGSIKSFRPYE